MCCVGGNIYLAGGAGDGRVREYNPRTNTWRNMPWLQEGRVGHSVCTLDNKIFVLGGGDGEGTTCEILDLSEDDPQWRYIAEMNNDHGDGGAVVKKKKNYAYVLGGCTTNVDVYDVDQNQWNWIVDSLASLSSASAMTAMEGFNWVEKPMQGAISSEHTNVLTLM